MQKATQKDIKYAFQSLDAAAPSASAHWLAGDQDSQNFAEDSCQGRPDDGTLGLEQPIKQGIKDGALAVEDGPVGRVRVLSD